MTTPDIPAWQWLDLQQLSAAGDLDNLNPIVLGSVDQAESSGNGGAINSQGYGGYFGLGESTAYPGGTTTPQLLESTSSAGFEEQAEIAASEFASLLDKVGGNPISAEEIYQSGSASGPTEGSNILSSNLGTAPAFLSGGSASLTDATDTSFKSTVQGILGFGGSSSTSTGVAGEVAGGVASVLGTILSPLKQWVEDAGLILLGVVIIIVALVVVAHAGLDAASGASSQEQATRQKVATTQSSVNRYRAPKTSSSASSQDKAAASDAESGVKSGVGVAEVAAA